MVSFGKNGPVSITVSDEEHKCLLGHCDLLAPALRRKIVARVGETIYLKQREADFLKVILWFLAENTDDEQVASLFRQVMRRIPLSRQMAGFLEHAGEEGGLDLEVIQRIWDEVEEEQAPAAPLTPQLINRFVDYRYGDPEFPLQFNRGLSLEELNRSAFFQNARLFLTKLVEHKDQPTATARGNLNRKFVRAVFDAMDIGESERDHIVALNKVINEEDVWDLHIIRVVCQCAGLIRRRSNRILVIRKHQHLLAEEKAGELYYRLFEAYFKKFNLAYADRLPEADGLQATIDFTLYRLAALCDEYQPVEELLHEVFLPAVVQQFQEESSKFVEEEWFLTDRVIEHLIALGLLECTRDESFLRRMQQVRKTPLFDKFITLNL